MISVNYIINESIRSPLNKLTAKLKDKCLYKEGAIYNTFQTNDDTFINAVNFNRPMISGTVTENRCFTF